MIEFSCEPCTSGSVSGSVSDGSDVLVDSSNLVNIDSYLLIQWCGEIVWNPPFHFSRSATNGLSMMHSHQRETPRSSSLPMPLGIGAAAPSGTIAGSNINGPTLH